MTGHAAGAVFDAAGARLDGDPLVVLLDIDGTLAPIAPRPEDARIPEDTGAVLRRLIGAPRTVVALVTGRAAADARRMAPEGAWIIGNHGLELLAPDGTLTPAAEGLAYESAVGAAVGMLTPLAEEVSGVIIEDKRWGLSVHYRLAGDGHRARIEQRVRQAAEASGLRVTEGKKIFELRPPVRVDKGTAVLEFLRRVDAVGAQASVFCAGDDRTDEDAFVALRAWSPRSLTVRVRSREDGDMPTSAELVVDSPAELLSVLIRLADRRERSRS